MFTGIITATGKIAARESRGGDAQLTIATEESFLHDVRTGDSIAVSGVCLTVITNSGDRFNADVSRESLARSTLAQLGVGHRVNLEKALTPTTPLGGHLVSGHVDGTGEVLAREEAGRSVVFRFRAPRELSRYIAEKGSICVDGVSLTVNRVNAADFECNIVPHTLRETTLGECKPGALVNLEVDLIARYLERLLCGEGAPAAPSKITTEFLQRHGFMK